MTRHTAKQQYGAEGFHIAEFPYHPRREMLDWLARVEATSYFDTTQKNLLMGCIENLSDAARAVAGGGIVDSLIYALAADNLLTRYRRYLGGMTDDKHPEYFDAFVRQLDKVIEVILRRDEESIRDSLVRDSLNELQKTFRNESRSHSLSEDR
jgi:hypothetical protein